MLREIIIFNSFLWRFGEGVEESLCSLVPVNAAVTVKVYLVRRPCLSGTIRHPDELKVWFYRRPRYAEDYLTMHSYNCTTAFPIFLPKLREVCRVVLMEERKEGTIVVVHDSHDSSICCDCGRDTGKGHGS